MPPFTFNTSASLRFGAGALSQIGALAQERLGGRVIVVTDAGMVAVGIVWRALEFLGEGLASRPPYSPMSSPIRRRR